MDAIDPDDTGIPARDAPLDADPFEPREARMSVAMGRPSLTLVSRTEDVSEASRAMRGTTAWPEKEETVGLLMDWDESSAVAIVEGRFDC